MRSVVVPWHLILAAGVALVLRHWCGAYRVAAAAAAATRAGRAPGFVRALGSDPRPSTTVGSRAGVAGIGAQLLAGQGRGRRGRDRARDGGCRWQRARRALRPRPQPFGVHRVGAEQLVEALAAGIAVAAARIDLRSHSGVHGVGRPTRCPSCVSTPMTPARSGRRGCWPAASPCWGCRCSGRGSSVTAFARRTFAARAWNGSATAFPPARSLPGGPLGAASQCRCRAAGCETATRRLQRRSRNRPGRGGAGHRQSHPRTRRGLPGVQASASRCPRAAGRRSRPT